MVKTLNVGIQMKACKNAIYFIFFLQAAANRLQIYKTLFIYLFLFGIQRCRQIKKPLFGIQRRRQIKKLLGVNEIQSKKNNNLVTKSTYRGCKDAPYISTFPIGR